MLLYALLSDQSVVEFYPTEAEARAALSDVLADEPEWEGNVGVAEIDLAAWPTWSVTLLPS